ncbi:MAG TPA: lytic transglycosylase domain-containing protein [Acidisoma sp.]|jgi:soluble lytic murein transglycosylase-like protein|nr:lytic transglycosylase domain-containing protein [Acidisoma sp.]
MPIRYLACMALAANFYALPPRVLPSIQHVEGGGAGAVRADANGSADLGVMQVNTIWLHPLSAYSGLAEDVVYQRLVNDPCFNIAAAAAIMRTYLNEAHGDLLKAVGYYHSHTAVLGEEYEQQVLHAARELFQNR